MTAGAAGAGVCRARLVALAQDAAVVVMVVVVAVLLTETGLVDATSNSLWVVIATALLVSGNAERRRRVARSSSA